MLTIVHYCSSFHPYNGNIFNHFEYFIFLLKHNVDVKLEFISDGCVTLDDILRVMEDRYMLNSIDYRNHITYKHYKNTNLIYDLVITNSKTLYDIGENLSCNKMYLVHTWASYNSPYKEKINEYLKDMNVISYNECELTGEANYIRPIYFDLLKKPKTKSDDLFLHLSGVREISFIDFIKYISPLRNDNQKVIVSLPETQMDKMAYLSKISYVELHTNHVHNLFEKFKTYIYIMLNGFDYSPRMIIESKYFNKEIVFIKKHNKKDGGYTRYNSCMNGEIEKFNMTKHDKLLGQFIC